MKRNRHRKARRYRVSDRVQPNHTEAAHLAQLLEHEWERDLRRLTLARDGRVGYQTRGTRP